MGKRIEEFTAEELYRVWAESKDGWVGGFLDVIYYIKANLDTGKREPMSVDVVARPTIDALQKALEEAGLSLEIHADGSYHFSGWKLEPMSVEEIEEWLKAGHWDAISIAPTLRMVADIIKPLTVQQGFVPDWSKYDPKVKTLVLYCPETNTMGETIATRPATKMRQKTREEKINDLDAFPSQHVRSVLTKLQDSTIDDLCRAAGIPLEAPE